MHILLTDILACPACGPRHGLIVRSDVMRERRVQEGALGCPNCERAFPVRGGIAFLDPDSTTEPSTPVSAPRPDPEAAVRIAALLGLDDATGFTLLTGPAAALATEVAELAGNIEIVADAEHAGPGGTSRVVLGERLPFYDGRLRGIWLSGPAASRWLEEAARSLHPLGRLVLEPAPDDPVPRLTRLGLKVAAAEEDTVLAMKA